MKFGPDSAGRIVELPTFCGNLVTLPHRNVPEIRKRGTALREVRKACAVIEFCPAVLSGQGHKGPDGTKPGPHQV